MSTAQENTETESLHPGLTSNVEYVVQHREPANDDGPAGPWADYVSMNQESFDTFDCALDVGAEACVTGHYGGLDLRILRVITTQYVEVAKSNKD